MNLAELMRLADPMQRERASQSADKPQTSIRMILMHRLGSHPAAAESAERQGSGNHAVAWNIWRVRVPPQRLQIPLQGIGWRSQQHAGPGHLVATTL